MKKVLFTILMSVLTLSSYAYDFKVNGIYYNRISGKTNEVEVTCMNFGGDNYSGNVTIPSTVTYSGTTYSVTSIGWSAFNGCSGLKSIEIPNSVISIGVGAFDGCNGLKSVTIPNSITSIGNNAFLGCSGLTSVTIPESVTSIGSYAFDGCKNVKELIYAEGTKTVLRTYLTSITSVTIPNSVTSIGDRAFYECSGLTSITIPNSVTSIGGFVFENCSSLTSITIPNSVTSIEVGAFSGCISLTSITIPNSVTSIESSAFSDTGWYKNQPDGLLYLDNCLLGYKGAKPIGSIVIKDSTRVIGVKAFEDCNLTSLTIPDSVTSIGEYAFCGCHNLKDVYNYATTPQSIDFFTFSGLPYGKTLHVVKGCKSAYASANYWKNFNIVEDLEPTAVKNIKKYKDNNLDNNIYNWQGFKGEGQINIKNRKKFVK